jgi:hypothetical protein
VIPGDSEQQRGADDQEPDAQIAREQRDDEPVAEVGEELALAPPRPPRIAGPEVAEDRETGPERERDRHGLHDGQADTVEDRDDFLDHDARLRVQPPQ